MDQESNVKVTATDATESSKVDDPTDSCPNEEGFFPLATKHAPQTLLPNNVTDEVAGTIQFAENFIARYGPFYPEFYQGSLDDAVTEAFFRPAKDRKLLAIYVHNDESIMSNLFSQHVFCHESTVSFLTNNFINWGWDVTYESNRKLFVSLVHKNFGAGGARMIRGLDKKNYPVVIIATRIHASVEISNVISCTVYPTVDELIVALMHAVELFETQQFDEVRADEEREARERKETGEGEQSVPIDQTKQELKQAQGQGWKLEENVKRNIEKKEENLMRNVRSPSDLQKDQ